MEIISNSYLNQNFFIGKNIDLVENNYQKDLEKNILIEIEITYYEYINKDRDKDQDNDNDNDLDNESENIIEYRNKNKSKNKNKEKLEHKNLLKFNLMKDNSEYINDINDRKKYLLENYKNSAKIYFPKEKIPGTFIEDELKSQSENHLKVKN
jgi:hypothetical protein